MFRSLSLHGKVVAKTAGMQQLILGCSSTIMEAHASIMIPPIIYQPGAADGLSNTRILVLLSSVLALLVSGVASDVGG